MHSGLVTIASCQNDAVVANCIYCDHVVTPAMLEELEFGEETEDEIDGGLVLAGGPIPHGGAVHQGDDPEVHAGSGS